MRKLCVASCLMIVMLVVSGTPLFAQTAEKTASQLY